MQTVLTGKTGSKKSDKGGQKDMSCPSAVINYTKHMDEADVTD